MARSYRTSWEGDFGGDLTEVVRKQLLKEGLEGERLITKVINGKGISVDGDLAKSVTSNVFEDGDTIGVEIGPSVDYAPYVQFPTIPHWAPIEPLKDWARKKLGDESAAYAVQWKIARRGTGGQDFLTGPLEKLAQESPERLEDAIAEHLDDD